jgi:hypothetical protein
VAGSTVFRSIDGGVPGGAGLDVNRREEGCAGEGEVARNNSKSAPSSPLPEIGRRRNAEGGVDGGEVCTGPVVLYGGNGESSI